MIGWPLFELAALDKMKSCDLSTVYYLFRQHSDHVEVFLNGKKKKKKQSPGVDDTNNTPHKRIKIDASTSVVVKRSEI